MEKIKTIEDVLNQLYMTSDDLRILIPSLGINQSRKYIKLIQETMKNDGCYIPKAKSKLVLTTYVKHFFGIKK